MLVCKVIEVWQDFLSEYVDKKFTYICYRRLIRHEWIYYGSKNCVIYNSYKIAVFTYHSPHFCFPWRRPCYYHAICCMNGKTMQCLPNPSQHVPVYYLQQFPSYSNLKCKQSPFSRTAAHIFVSLEMPLRLSRSVLHGWKDNSMLAKPLAACTFLYSIVSELYDD